MANHNKLLETFPAVSTIAGPNALIRNLAGRYSVAISIAASPPAYIMHVP